MASIREMDGYLHYSSTQRHGGVQQCYLKRVPLNAEPFEIDLSRS